MSESGARTTPGRASAVLIAILAAALLAAAALVMPARPASAATCPPPPPGGSGLPAPPGCEQEPSEKKAPSSAAVCVRLVASPAGTIMPGDVVVYEIGLAVQGAARARQVTVTLPHPPDQTIADVKVTGPEAWVSAVTSDSLELSLGTLHSGAVLSATVSLRTLATAKDGASLAGRVQASWSGRREAWPHVSNALSLVVGSRQEAAQQTLTVTSGAAPAGVTVKGMGFASLERVGLWYTTSDGQTAPLATGQADAEGALVYSIAPEKFPRGPVTLVARGACSGQTLTAALT